jgi:hypothetical protein
MTNPPRIGCSCTPSYPQRTPLDPRSSPSLTSGTPCVQCSVVAVTCLCHYPSCQGTTTETARTQTTSAGLRTTRKTMGTATTQITSADSKTFPPPPVSKTATTTTSMFQTLPPWTLTKIVLTLTPAPAMPPLRHCAHHHAIPPNNCPHHLTTPFFGLVQYPPPKLSYLLLYWGSNAIAHIPRKLSSFALRLVLQGPHPLERYALPRTPLESQLPLACKCF